MKKALCCTVILAMCCLAAPLQAPASKPVLKTLTGCVINGTLFSVRQYKSDTPGQAKTVVYQYRMEKVNLAPYEGKKIQVEGYLHPGDRFTPDLKTLKVLGPCDRESQEAINRDKR
jgi:hypothetical protein